MEPVGQKAGSWQGLFTAHLRFRDGMNPIVSSKGRQGRMIGSGNGFVRGRRLHGLLSWTLFEDLSDTFAVIDHALVLETVDGGVISFDAQGFAVRTNISDPAWTVIGALRFHTADYRYIWVNDALGVWRGLYDAQAREARYRAFSWRLDDAPSGATTQA